MGTDHEGTHTFRLMDADAGVDALLVTSEDQPGKVRVLVLAGDQFIPPTPEQLQAVLDLPESAGVRLNMAVTAVAAWPSWRGITSTFLTCLDGVA